MPDATLDQRLAALYADLERFPPGVLCPWPVARVFNRLLEIAKSEHGDDPVVSGIAVLRENGGEEGLETAATVVGAVLVLVAQIRVAAGVSAA